MYFHSYGEIKQIGKFMERNLSVLSVSHFEYGLLQKLLSFIFSLFYSERKLILWLLQYLMYSHEQQPRDQEKAMMRLFMSLLVQSLLKFLVWESLLTFHNIRDYLFLFPYVQSILLSQLNNHFPDIHIDINYLSLRSSLFSNHSLTSMVS